MLEIIDEDDGKFQQNDKKPFQHSHFQPVGRDKSMPLSVLFRAFQNKESKFVEDWRHCFALCKLRQQSTIHQSVNDFMERIYKLIRRPYFPAVLFIFSLALFLFNSWGVSIYFLDEAKNATCAREMLESGNWLLPTFNYEMRTDKPPLFYFFTILSYKLFGVNPFAARFFSAVFGALTILVVFRYIRRFKDEKRAFWSAFVLLSSIHIAIQFHLAVPDPMLIFFTTWGMLAFYSAVEFNKRRDLWFSYIAMALGTMAKGPVAILLPGLTFLLFLFFSGNFNWNTIRRLRPVAGGLIILAITLPWFVLNGLETNWEWTKGFFLEHNFQRYTEVMEAHGGNPLVVLFYIFLGILPFTTLLPQTIFQAVKNRKDNFLLFNLLAVGVIIVFYAFSSTKLPNYTVPAYPFLATLLAWFFLEKVDNFRKVRVAWFSLFVVSCLVTIVVFASFGHDPSLLPVREITLLLLFWPGLIASAWMFRKNVQEMLAFIGLSGITTSLIFFGVVYPVLERQNPITQSLDMLEGRKVAYIEKYNPAFSFYLKRKIQLVDWEHWDDFFEQYPDALIISTESRMQRYQLSDNYEIVFAGKDLFETPTTILIGKKKNGN